MKETAIMNLSAKVTNHVIDNFLECTSHTNQVLPPSGDNLWSSGLTESCPTRQREVHDTHSRDEAGCQESMLQTSSVHHRHHLHPHQQQQQECRAGDQLTQRTCRHNTHTHTHTHTQPFNGLLSGTTRVGRYQKKHSPTHTHPDHRTSFIIFLHLQRSMASSLFSLRA